MTTAKPLPPLAPGETRAYPVLPLRDLVVFPHMIAPLFVGRKKSILALEEVMRSDTFILLATQKNASDDDPATEAIYEVGTLASILQLLKLPDGTVKALVEGAQPRSAHWRRWHWPNNTERKSGMQLPVGEGAVTRPFRIIRGAIGHCPPAAAGHC